MLKFLNRNKTSEEPSSESLGSQQATQKKPSLFGRLKQGLHRTRHQLTNELANLILGRKVIDDALFEDIETQLLLADIGVEATRQIINDLTERVSRKQLTDGDALYAALRNELTTLLMPCENELQIDSTQKPYVILMIGVNGSGKTTTIGKLANRLQKQGHKVMLAAGDTFRAAAIEQLQAWGERHQVPVIAQQTGSDSASVIYDALQSAKARDIDVLIADTAGRLHTQLHLMEELKKVKRVITKLAPTAPHEVMLVLDAGVGQNAIVQTDQFHEAINITGITLTKFDGTAKGGIIFAIAKNFGIPFRFIGVGESSDDLRPFRANEFVNALFENEVETVYSDHL